MGIILFAMYLVTAITVQGTTAEVQGKNITQANQEYNVQHDTADYANLNK